MQVSFSKFSRAAHAGESNAAVAGQDHFAQSRRNVSSDPRAGSEQSPDDQCIHVMFEAQVERTRWIPAIVD